MTVTDYYKLTKCTWHYVSSCNYVVIICAFYLQSFAKWVKCAYNSNTRALIARHVNVYLTIFYAKMYVIDVNCACNSNSVNWLLISYRYWRDEKYVMEILFCDGVVVVTVLTDLHVLMAKWKNIILYCVAAYLKLLERHLDFD